MKTEKKPATAATPTKAHIAILEARYYGDICDELAKGAITALERSGATWDRIAVPGALEIPGAVAMAHASGRYDGFVATGCVLRGETSHYDIVANESARGLVDLTLKGVIVGNAILTCETEAQAWARARVDDGDKGGWAADAALTMVRLARRLKPRARKAAAKPRKRS